MGALGLEAIFVSNVGDGVGNAVSSYERELSPNSDSLIFGTSVSELPFLLGRSSIASFISVKRETNQSFRSLYFERYNYIISRLLSAIVILIINSNNHTSYLNTLQILLQFVIYKIQGVALQSILIKIAQKLIRL